MLQAVNNYDKDVYNGDPGYISEIDPKARRVVVNYPSTSSGTPKINPPLPSSTDHVLTWRTSWPSPAPASQTVITATPQ